MSRGGTVQLYAARDRPAAVIQHAVAMAVDEQRHSAGRTADRADPDHDVRDRAIFAAADVKQVAGAENLAAIVVAFRQLDRADRHRAHVGFQGGAAVGLAVNAGADADAKTLVEDKAGQVAAIDPLAVVPGGGRLPGPAGGRIPVRNVMVLIVVAQKAGGRGHHPLALPLDRLLGQLGQRRIEPRLRPPRTEAAARVPGVPLAVGQERLAGRIAPLALEQVANQIGQRIRQLETVRRIGFAQSRRGNRGRRIDRRVVLGPGRLPVGPGGHKRRGAPSTSAFSADRRDNISTGSGCIESPPRLTFRWLAKLYVMVGKGDNWLDFRPDSRGEAWRAASFERDWCIEAQLSCCSTPRASRPQDVADSMLATRRRTKQLFAHWRQFLGRCLPRSLARHLLNKKPPAEGRGSTCQG